MRQNRQERLKVILACLFVLVALLMVGHIEYQDSLRLANVQPPQIEANAR